MPIPEWDAHDPAQLDADDLTRAYVESLQAAATAAADRLEPAANDALQRGDGGALTLADAARILATQTNRLDADAIHAELLDRLLIGMSNAVVDVETLAGELPLALSAKELQQRIEGRAPMSVAEYAEIRCTLGRRRP